MTSMENNYFNNQENQPISKIEVEPDFIDFIPTEFKDDPIKYFEDKGKNIKNGEVKIDEEGKIRDDPTAVKDLPVWLNEKGEELFTVGKRINLSKGAVGESGDPFYEYNILKKLAKMELPAARPVAKIEQNENHLIIMERIPGIRWSERDTLHLKEKGYSDRDIETLMSGVQEEMNSLKESFEAAGVVRGWKLNDMVFQIDIENKKITSIVPTDWERTVINK